jgi:hypothetical protein
MGRNDLGRFPRWDQELTEMFGGYALEIAPTAAAPIADFFDVSTTSTPRRLGLSTTLGSSAESFNDATHAALEEVYSALGLEPDTELSYAGVFDLAAGARADAAAADRVTQVANFSRQDAAHQGGATTKTWITTSGNARPSHAGMNGETVNIDETFSNGGLWPRDPSLSADESAGCDCLVDFTEADPTTDDTTLEE